MDIALNAVLCSSVQNLMWKGFIIKAALLRARSVSAAFFSLFFFVKPEKCVIGV